MVEHAAAFPGARHEEQFESLAQQVHAAHLGMWIFLGSETLLFAALFGLYASYRAMYPDVVAFGVGHNAQLLGSLNTVVLLTSSFTVAASTRTLALGRRGVTLALLATTIALALTFLVVKAFEYGQHYQEGIYVDGTGPFFAEHPLRGLPVFFLLYYLMTGLHALHVVVGMLLLGYLALRVAREGLSPPHDHPLHLGALYWHLVDVIWIFLWPLFYLTRGGQG
jgi:cytochrome c oxidase subunit 3